MLSRNDELDMFKREVNLAEFAALHGYQRDSKKSTRHTYSMRDEAGNHLVVSINPATGHWRWFNPVDPENEAGSIIDFVQMREQVSIGEVRKILRDHLRMPAPSGIQDYDRPAPQKKSRSDVVDYLRRFHPVDSSSYAESRGIRQETLTALPFQGRILKGFKGALIFPHWDDKGLCGYEVKAFGFTSFSSKGFKSLWVSRIPATLNSIVVCESGIEALSYYQYRNPPHTLFVSAGGNWSKEVSGRLEKLFERFPGAEVIGAFNNDQGGARQGERLKELVSGVGSSYRNDFPAVDGADWNNMINHDFGAPKRDDKEQDNG
ncbi:toprim domain-containing protein [Marinobacter salarius]|uniref:toprim domain-containing protein n=1 Tax=Marinobacter salarius TaxID=1420917 RepID=UPI001258A438|nr:toprim domain-containing protein [Marinobacter salarius]VVT28059.1 conserved hypothetical protein [Marinobacter salarius]